MTPAPGLAGREEGRLLQPETTISTGLQHGVRFQPAVRRLAALFAPDPQAAPPTPGAPFPPPFPSPSRPCWERESGERSPVAFPRLGRVPGTFRVELLPPLARESPEFRGRAGGRGRRTSAVAFGRRSSCSHLGGSPGSLSGAGSWGNFWRPPAAGRRGVGVAELRWGARPESSPAGSLGAFPRAARGARLEPPPPAPDGGRQRDLPGIRGRRAAGSGSPRLVSSPLRPARLSAGGCAKAGEAEPTADSPRPEEEEEEEEGQPLLRGAGICKWFNVRMGFGFLAMTAKEGVALEAPVDVFVHQVRPRAGGRPRGLGCSRPAPLRLSRGAGCGVLGADPPPGSAPLGPRARRALGPGRRRRRRPKGPRGRGAMPKPLPGIPAARRPVRS